MIDLSRLKIGDLEINGIIQGAMGVGISLSGLAPAVANCGGAGILATVGIGLLKGYFEKSKKNYVEANQRGLREEIRKARKKSNGVIGVNIMFALFDYESLVKTSIEEKVDLLIVGAGPALGLVKLVKNIDSNTNTKLVPIISKGEKAKNFCRAWGKHGHLPDAIVVEGPKAGGHLGFNREQLNDPKLVENGLEIGVKKAVEVVKNYETPNHPIPIIAAGGIYSGQDIKKAISWGASGVQMATRFVPTLECDADDKFKKAYLDASQEDIIIIDSPVGMPGRAIKNKFLEKIQVGEKYKFPCDFQCLKTCKPKESPYCIANALVEAQQGNFTRGYAFAGANAYKCTPGTCLDENGDFISVRTLMERLSDEYNK